MPFGWFTTFMRPTPGAAHSGTKGKASRRAATKRARQARRQGRR